MPAPGGAPAPLTSPAEPAAPQPAPSAATAPLTAGHAAAQAKRLMAQYQHDPFRLSVALSELKTAYLADQHHITSNTADQ